MRYKPNWPEAQKRLTALWHGELLDRPCISVKSPQPIVDPLSVPEPADGEARWLDPDYVVPLALNDVKATWWGGEAMPGHFLMACWVNCLGGAPRFDSRTIWFDIEAVDFFMPPPFRHDAASPWSRKYIALLQAMWRAAGKDDFCVPPLPGLPANDVISMLMGTENFLVALMDHPDWMAEAVMTGARERIALAKSLQELARKSGHAFWYGLVGWMLDPALLMLQTHCAGREEAERLLEQAVKWTSRR